MKHPLTIQQTPPSQLGIPIGCGKNVVRVPGDKFGSSVKNACFIVICSQQATEGPSKIAKLVPPIPLQDALPNGFQWHIPGGEMRWDKRCDGHWFVRIRMPYLYNVLVCRHTVHVSNTIINTIIHTAQMSKSFYTIRTTHVFFAPCHVAYGLLHKACYELLQHLCSLLNCIHVQGGARSTGGGALGARGALGGSIMWWWAGWVALP